jgi:hypothetical protein
MSNEQGWKALLIAHCSLPIVHTGASRAYGDSLMAR